MRVQLNHTLVAARDKAVSARFLAEMFDLPDPYPYGPFLCVDIDNGVSLDFYQKDGAVSPQHYAFLVSDEEFDSALSHIAEDGLDYWADPARSQPGQINTHFGGRGVYFAGPDNHLPELITKPYGSESGL